MPQSFSSVMTRLGDAVKAFTIAQRTIAIIGVAVLALGVAALVTWSMKPSYTPLFSGLNGEDASIIVEQLRTDNIPYEISGGGGTILVPEESVYDQRLKAAAAGLPSSSTAGYSLLDDMGVTSSEFQESVTYKRALEGELAATVSALSGVKNASVRLAIPEESVFVSEAGTPTASVFIETDSGVTLSSEQVQAVAHLTSASIDGMVPENVAVIDADGNVLSAVGVGATGSVNQQSSDYEETVRASVQSMLDRVVGPGNASVVVAADMNTEFAERVEESFTTPDGDPALNESTTTEEYEGAGGAAAGVLGPDNIAGPDDTGGEGNFNSETSTRNNAVNKITESTTIPAGAINRQTVSVALDEEAAGALDLAGLTGLVTAAAGINEDRGDLVTVEVLPFNNAGAAEAAEALAAADEAAAAEARAQLMMQVGVIAALVLLAIIIALVVYARKSRRQRREPVDLGELQEVIPVIGGPAIGDLGPTRMVEPAPDTTSIDLSAIAELGHEDAMSRKRADIEAMAVRDPAKTADYLRSLMDDRQPV
ncbi:MULTISPECIES: flagellar basal-body MS-ring/collar protein FliF [unclassified Arthrobacter]|uniref:flagellar basal-body MS-ring/collar protein FliF n=1 Tax=unclassified Arthrobacter TaxID=235627 RepID=UPI001491F362|nr:MULTISPECIES: flagellar basal-body MS-ring/collar protein FliF [unclassified Arthrobacter]MBE0010803.1 flagellar M-ring protein FliF [Arthrobacter sp. AET 35A]NOJ60493.1 flagellar M-ring protein FliF [Arthrobacter sp. 260]NOJ64630.1 flagellar M-ring protein FliF [Arthrobacter sp. 147(2020)]